MNSMIPRHEIKKCYDEWMSFCLYNAKNDIRKRQKREREGSLGGFSLLEAAWTMNLEN